MCIYEHACTKTCRCIAQEKKLILFFFLHQRQAQSTQPPPSEKQHADMKIIIEVGSLPFYVVAHIKGNDFWTEVVYRPVNALNFDKNFYLISAYHYYSINKTCFIEYRHMLYVVILSSLWWDQLCISEKLVKF